MKTTNEGLGGPAFPAINNDGTVTIADSGLLLSGSYSRDGDDLIISGQDGQQLHIVEYFSQSTLPDLISNSGASLSGDTVSLLAGPLAPGQYAQADDGQFGEVIGQVETMSGSATAQRPNGVTVELDIGSPVFQGDVVSVGSNSSLGITFIDKTVFTIDDGATMVLNEMVYSPSGSSNSMLFNLLGGTAAFVAGAVAKTGDMKVETPVAVMAIRGTTPFVGCDQTQGSCYYGGESGVYDLLHKSLGKVIATVNDPAKIVTVTSIDEAPSTSAPNASQLATMGKLFGTLRGTMNLLEERLDQGEDPVREGDAGSTNFGDAGEMRGIVSSTAAVNQGAAGGEVEQLLDPTGFDQTTDARQSDSFNLQEVRPPISSLTDEDSRTTVTAFTGPEATAPVPIIVSAVITSGLGAVSISADGKSLIYDPGTAYNSLSVDETAQVKIALVIDQGDGTTRSDEATVNVVGINDLPAAAADTAIGNEESAISIDVLANDTDPDANDDLTVSQASVSAGRGTVSIAGDGQSILYDPAGAYDQLSVGETANVVISYQVSDGEGGFASSTATVTVSGLNDRPLTTGPDDTGRVTERPDGAANENSAVLSSAGVIAFTDVDLGDSHVVSVTPAGGGYRGALVADIANSATGDGAGSVAWRFSVRDAELDDLAARQSLEQTYSIKIDDGNGGVTTQNVVISLRGSNDAPDISGSQSIVGSATELADGDSLENSLIHSSTGRIAFSDSDLTDSHTVEVDSNGLGYLGVLRAIVSNAATGDGVGQLAWSFRVRDSDLDSLGAGQQLVQSYTLTVQDGQGGTETQNVAITIRGSNDGPIITSSVGSGSVDASGVGATQLSANGLLDFIDVDLIDGHTVSVLASPAGYRGELTASISDAATGDGKGKIGWQFVVDDADLDDLAASQTIDQTYTIQIEDGNGGVTTQNVIISLNGSNNAPVIAGNQTITGTVTELTDDDGLGGNPIVAATGRIAFSDLDLTDSHSVVVDSNGTDYLGIFRAIVKDAATDDGVGQLAWSFRVRDNDLDSLGAGQSLIQTYTLTVQDGQGETDTQDVTITVRGSNDGPVVTSPAGAGSVDASGAGASLLSANGLLDFTDADLIDGHTVSVLASPAGYRGDLTASISNAATGDGNGAVGWQFQVDDADLDDLAASQTIDQTYTIQIDDGNGGVTTQNVIISLNGSNDAPVIAGNQSVSGSVTELADGNGLENNFTHTATAQIAFSDVDLADGHTVSVAANGAGYRGNLTATVNTAATGTGLGLLAWTFQVSDSDLEELGDGDSLSQSYTLTLKDDVGSTATEIISITINGTNDAPVFTSAIGTGSVTEIASGQPGDGTAILSTSGSLNFADVELSDSHTVSVAGSPADYRGTLTASISDTAQGDGSGSVIWTFNVADADLKDLTSGQAVNQTYSVNVTDSNGGVGTQTVVVTINGTNNAPIIAGGAGSTVLVVVNDGDPGDQSPTGTFSFTDIDLTDNHSVSVIPGDAGYFGDMTAVVQDPSFGDGFGSIFWQFTIPDGEFDGVVINPFNQVYTLKVDDGNGGTDTQRVTIRIQDDGITLSPSSSSSSSSQLIRTASSVESYKVTIDDNQDAAAPLIGDGTRTLSYETPVALTTFQAVISDVDGETAALQLRLTDTNDAVVPLGSDDISVMIAPGNTGAFEVQQLGDSVVVTGLQEGDTFAIDSPAPFNKVEVENASDAFSGSDFTLGVQDFGASAIATQTGGSGADVFKFDGNATSDAMTDIIADYEEGIDVIDLTALFDIAADAFNEGAIEDYARYKSGNDNDGAADPSGSDGDLFIDADGAANGEDFILLAHSATASDNIIVKVDDDAGALGYVTII